MRERDRGRGEQDTRTMGAHKQVAANCDDNDDVGDDGDGDGNYLQRRYTEKDEARGEGEWVGVGCRGQTGASCSALLHNCVAAVSNVRSFLLQGASILIDAPRCLPATFSALSLLLTFFPLCVCVCVCCPSASSCTLYSPATPCPAPL